MKALIKTLLLTICTLTAFSQDFEVPANYKFATADDYTLHQDDVIRGIDWLMATPLNEQQEKRKAVNAFVLAWLTGSPTVHVEVKPDIVTFIGKSPDLLMMFLGGWAKHALQTPGGGDKVSGTMAGLEAVIDFYTRNKEKIGRDKAVEKYIKMKEKGTLQDYVKEHA